MEKKTRVFYHDIEVMGKEGDYGKPENPRKPITSISVVDSLEMKVIAFTFREDIIIPEGKKCNVEKGRRVLEPSKIEVPETRRIYNKEVAMLKDFAQFFSYYEPDIVTGWNSNGFDIPYILRRFDRLKLKNFKKVFSPMGKVYCFEEIDTYGEVEKSKKYSKKGSWKKTNWKIMIGGSVCFDLMVGHINIKGSHEDGSSLNAVIKRELSEDLSKLSENILGEDWYENDIGRFIDYNIMDSVFCHGIDEQVGIIDHHDFVVRFSGCLWENVFNRTQVVDAFYLHNAEEIALPTKLRQQRESYKGAVVFEPRIGLHIGKDFYEICLDLAKMYPMNVISCNMSPEMIVTEGEADDPKTMIILGNGVRFYKPIPIPLGTPFDPKTMVVLGEEGRKQVTFWKDSVGFVPRILNKMFQMRTIIEKELKKTEYGSKEWIDLNAKKFNAKITINSVYGWLAYPGGRFYHIDIARSITWLGRKLIIWTSKMAKRMGYDTLYGDTDSIIPKIFAKSFEECLEKGFELARVINKSYDKFARRYNIDHHFFSLEMEKVFSFMYFKAKKRYLGNLIWLDGKKIYRKDDPSKLGQLFYKGIEMKRTDSAWITKEVQKKIFTMLGDGEPAFKIRNYLQDIVDRILAGKYSLLQVGIPRGMGQEFHEYETDSPWLRGCIYMNEEVGTTNFGKGSKPKLLYIKKVRGETYPPTDAICIDLNTPPISSDFVIDWEKMAQKTIRDKIDVILDDLEIDWDVLVTGVQNDTLDRWITA